MRRWVMAALVTSAVFTMVPRVYADPVYLALGDSITFGETDLRYIPSFGDRGYVSRFADYLASVEGERPQVVNFAIDGETTASFMSGAGRLPPVVGRTDPILAAQNLNYAGNLSEPQRSQFLTEVAAQQAAGNTITTVSISLGFNDLFQLAGMPDGVNQIGPTLEAYRANYSMILSNIRQVLPGVELFMLNYYNPFVADPGNPAQAIAAIGGPQLNAIIRDLAGQFGGIYVDTFTPFVGREDELTYIDEMPAGSSIGPPFGGLLPIGNAHANDAGYDVIASAVIEAAETNAVPEPASLLLMASASLVLLRSRTRARRA